ncbi:hypothetical protein KI387_019935, partial [Taxus chinensis]
QNQGEKHTYIKTPRVVSIEETEVVSDRTRELQDSYGKAATKTFAGNNSRIRQKEHPRKRVGFGEKTNLLVDMILKLKDSKEAVYGALDSWAALEETFPSNALKRALYMLEKKQQWHRIIQVIKWMLSKGQCTTMNTYEQLLHALEKDRRAEEAHAFWEMRIGSNLQSVPWQLCTSMMCLYQRNNMPERLIELFNDLEMYNRKPPDKTIIKTVADAYELLGLEEEQERVLEKYSSLFKESSNNRSKKKKERKEKDSDGENTGDEKLTSEANLPTDSKLLLDNILSICDAGSNSNGTANASINY